MNHAEELQDRAEIDIAIIGMAGRFPGAGDVEVFWRNLRDGVESITFFTNQELLERGVSPETFEDPLYVKAGAQLEGVDLFDASFFGFTPREAAETDPQHRLFLEVAWQALEDAGYDPFICTDPIGVYVAAVSILICAEPVFQRTFLGHAGYFLLAGLDERQQQGLHDDHRLLQAQLAGPGNHGANRLLHLACSGACGMSRPAQSRGRHGYRRRRLGQSVA